MKKCPYCKTLMNDEVTSCPNCQRDVSNLSPMPDIASENNKGSFYTFMFGLIISFGGVFASLSTRANRLNYQTQMDELVAQYESTKSEELLDKILRLSANIKTCEFREVFFYIAAALGVGLIIYSLVRLIIKKAKTKKEIKGGN